MPSITIRNIPDSLLQKIKILANLEKRSMNSEFLMALEKGVAQESQQLNDKQDNISKEAQIAIWKNITGKWEDDRSTQEIIEDIYSHRTLGRNIEL